MSNYMCCHICRRHAGAIRGIQLENNRRPEDPCTVREARERAPGSRRSPAPPSRSLRCTSCRPRRSSPFPGRLGRSKSWRWR